MRKPPSMFGLRAILKNYGWKSFGLDSILPLIISSSICIFLYLKEGNVFEQLKHLIEIGVSIVPAMVALILTAYTIVLTFFIGDKFILIRNTEKGKQLIQDLNSSFAACLLVSTISIITMIVISSIAHMEIKIEKPNFVNYPVFFFVCYLLVYSVSILFGTIIDIFNSGQTTLFEDNNIKR